MMRPYAFLLLALCPTLAACSAAPWAARSPAAVPPGANGPSPATPASAPAQPTVTAVPPQTLQQLMEEIQQAGNLDPATQERLLEDLQKTDPALWPLVMQQFRASAAYARQAQKKLPPEVVSATTDPAAANVARPAEATARYQPKPASTTTSESAPEAAAAKQSNPPEQQVAKVQRLPATKGVPLPPQSAPADKYPQTAPAQVAGEPGPIAAPTSAAQAKPSQESSVVPASYEQSQDWRKHLEAAIRAREAELRQGGKTAEDELNQAQLRLLYLLAGRRDDALKPIPFAAPPTQAFWTAELYGLSACLDTSRSGDASQRSAEARQHLGEALIKLGETCSLIVRNVSFCSEIQSFGCIKRFEKYEFTPGQRVLLYGEVENFASEPTPQGYHTSLRSTYQIFDSRGQRVANEEFTLTEEYCLNPRHDYFTGYVLRMPEHIYPGKHTLQLTIEDLKSRKIGQSSVEFTIKKTGDR